MLEVSWWFLYFRLSRPGWGIYVGIRINELSHLPTARGWARVPRQGYPSGGQGGQRGCREALPPRRPWKPGEGRSLGTGVGRYEADPLFPQACYVLVKQSLSVRKCSNRPTWVLQGRLSFCYPRFVYMNPSLVWVLVAHRQLDHKHAVEEQKQSFIQLHSNCSFQISRMSNQNCGYICAMIGSGFRVMLAFLVT